MAGLNATMPFIEKRRQERLQSIFFAHYLKRKHAFLALPNPRFVHYTSAAVALSIIQKAQVWLRNSTLMNDFSEVTHGQNCVFHSWARTPSGDRLRELIRIFGDTTLESFMQSFDNDQPSRQLRTFLTSVSEHGSEAEGGLAENSYGRLSMWRAYGGETNVALVMNPTQFLSESDALSAYTHPVLYADEEMFATHFAIFVKRFEDNLDFLKSLEAATVSAWLHEAFRSMVLATKHPGFSEEREWRILYTPDRDDKKRISKYLECVEGVPQIVYKMPLKNIPEEGLTDIEIPQLIESIIIGPTPYARDVAAALCEALNDAGVQNAAGRIVTSGIPLRR